MKKQILFIAFSNCLFHFSFGQELVETKNGINVYQSSGVKTEQKNVLLNNPTRTIEDWNLAECDQAIADATLKFSTLNSQDSDYENQVKNYKQFIQLVENRKKIILENK
jgi:capsid protein